jgi:hypothetical protein
MGKSKKENYPRAKVREVNGQFVLEDPVAVALVGAINRVGCEATFDLHADRIEHFKQRAEARGLTPANAVIVIVNVDDVYGGPLAEALMPGFNWQEIRDRGEIPFARGLADKSGIQEAIRIFDKEAAEELGRMDTLAVVVFYPGVAEVFPA